MNAEIARTWVPRDVSSGPEEAWTMVTADELDRLLLVGLENTACEIKFACALLDTTLSTHGPSEEQEPGNVNS